MSDRDAIDRLGTIARKWRELADRRREYFTELYESGRWRRYYSEANLLARMREVVTNAERWAVIAPQPTDKAPEPAANNEIAAKPQHRTAA
jgi:uncharacterized repeat protein (TIGR03809 family)